MESSHSEDDLNDLAVEKEVNIQYLLSGSVKVIPGSVQVTEPELKCHALLSLWQLEVWKLHYELIPVYKDWAELLTNTKMYNCSMSGDKQWNNCCQVLF